MGAQVTPRTDGVLAVDGALTFDTVPDIYQSSVGLVTEGAGPLTVDLATVRKADSAGLALLVEWRQRAGHAGRELRFTNVPEQVKSLTRVSGLSAVLGI
jgi:phospholipid transport system transporter-binding protein